MRSSRLRKRELSWVARWALGLDFRLWMIIVSGFPMVLVI